MLYCCVVIYASCCSSSFLVSVLVLVVLVLGSKRILFVKALIIINRQWSGEYEWQSKQKYRSLVRDLSEKVWF